MENCPFTGLPCSQDKPISIFKIINDKMVKINFCTNCSKNVVSTVLNKDKGFLNSVLYGLKLDKFIGVEGLNDLAESIKTHDDLNNFLAFVLGEGKSEFKDTSRRCPLCDTSAWEVIRNGKLGCAGCYESFNDLIVPLLEKLQDGASSHIGKRPKNNLSLEESLKKAIKEERYEDAATIRDKIKQLTQSALLDQ